MPDSKTINIVDDQFEQKVLKGTGLSVVYFWSPRCGPCHQMAPALEALAQANGDKVQVFRIDADENPKTVEKYYVRSTPTLLFFQNGTLSETKPGSLSQNALQEKVDQLLNR